MEEKAIDFTQRLVTKRLQFYCQEEPATYFETESDDFWKITFYSCLGNPRILGYILYYCYEMSTIYGQRIGIRTIKLQHEDIMKKKFSNIFD